MREKVYKDEIRAGSRDLIMHGIPGHGKDVGFYTGAFEVHWSMLSRGVIMNICSTKTF